MNVMSWLNEDYGSPELPAGPGDGPANLGSVIDTFVQNDAGFTPAEVSGYINRAIVNDATDIRQAREYARELENQYEGVEDRPSEKIDSILEEANAKYESEADVFARTLTRVVSEKSVVLEENTIHAIAQMDTDGIVRDEFETTLGQSYEKYGVTSEKLKEIVAEHYVGKLNEAPGIGHALDQAYGSQSDTLRSKISTGAEAYSQRELAMVRGAFAHPDVAKRERRQGRAPEVSTYLNRISTVLTKVSSNRIEREQETTPKSSGVDFSKGAHLQPIPQQRQPIVALRQSAPAVAVLPQDPQPVSSILDDYFKDAGISFDEDDEVDDAREQRAAPEVIETKSYKQSMEQVRDRELGS